MGAKSDNTRLVAEGEKRCLNLIGQDIFLTKKFGPDKKQLLMHASMLLKAAKNILLWSRN